MRKFVQEEASDTFTIGEIDEDAIYIIVGRHGTFKLQAVYDNNGNNIGYDWLALYNSNQHTIHPYNHPSIEQAILAAHKDAGYTIYELSSMRELGEYLCSL